MVRFILKRKQEVEDPIVDSEDPEELPPVRRPVRRRLFFEDEASEEF